ncbi:ATP-grasp domain-containing protein [Lapidilactobacillus salsurivasis]
MKYFIYRFSPESIGLQPANQLAIVCPSQQRQNYLSVGFAEQQVFTVADFSLLELLLFFKSQPSIDDIFSLDEGLIHLVGILKAIFTDDKNAWEIAYAYKDKKMMRQTLAPKIKQPSLIDPCATDALPAKFIIKPRREDSGRGVAIVTAVPDYFNSTEYLLETVETFDVMFTCDGIAINGEIGYFFSHEYVGNILAIKTDFFNLIRTNSHYQSNDHLIERLEAATQAVLTRLGTDTIQPFHAEFFYRTETDELSFCEIGKRFGGGQIPLLVKQAFNFDLLATYWALVNNAAVPQVKDYQRSPTCLAVTLAIFQNGRQQVPPEITVPLAFFREYPQQPARRAKSLADLRYLLVFCLPGNREFNQTFLSLRGYFEHEQRK